MLVEAAELLAVRINRRGQPVVQEQGAALGCREDRENSRRTAPADRFGARKLRRRNGHRMGRCPMARRTPRARGPRQCPVDASQPFVHAVTPIQL